jgi:uncharacterized membrane protein YhiD involved in acid resistance
MQQQIEQFLSDSVTNASINNVATVVVNLLLAMILGIVIAQVYKKVHKGISYSESYAFSIVIVTMVVAFVVMVIGSNVARAFTLIGAFTLIRYRTAVKDPKDTAFIFLALVVGLASGASDYAIAITGAAIVAATALILSKLNFGSLIKLEQVLYLTIDSKETDQASLETMLRGLFKEVSIINVNYNSANKSLQYSYNVTVGKKNLQDRAMRRISEIHGVKNAELLASQQVVEF